VNDVKVLEVMTPLIVSVNCDAPIAAAAQFMRSNDVGFLPVRDRGQLVGSITDRDIAVRAAAHDWDMSATPVEQVMTPSVVTVRQDVRTDEALRVMHREGVSRLMVVDDRERLVGVVSVRDIPRAAVD
jgi:CBS domain-containing protein